MKTAKWAGVMVALGTGSAAIVARPSRAAHELTTLRALYGLERPSSLVASHTALVLIDFQGEFVRGRLPLPQGRAAIERAAELAAWARRSGILVVLVQNVSNRPQSPIFAPGAPTTEIVPELRPQAADFLLQKSMASAFTRTQFDAELRGRGIDTLIIGGLMTHLAVHGTASDATALGYRVVVAADATATRALPGAAGEGRVDASTLKRAELAALADRAADVMPSHAIMALPVAR